MFQSIKLGNYGLMYTSSMSGKLAQLHAALFGCTQLLIIPHNDPDPDAIASTQGLCYLVSEKFGIQSRIGYRGIIGRAENKALLRYMKYPLHKLDFQELNKVNTIALVDTQPGTGNNPVHENISAAIVIDHHEKKNFQM